MNSDNYEFSKSSSPQDPADYSAYTDKQWNYVNDINSGVYNTSGQSLVQFDLSNIYNSGLSDVSDLYLTIPLVMVATTSNGSTLKTPKKRRGEEGARKNLISNFQAIFAKNSLYSLF